MNDNAAARAFRKRETDILDLMDHRNRMLRLQWLLSRAMPDDLTFSYFHDMLVAESKKKRPEGKSK